MEPSRPSSLASVFAAVCACAAFASCSASGAPSASPTCGPPPPSAAPIAYLSYPVPNATGVPISIGELIIAGNPATPDTISLAAGSTTIPGGAFSPAPSPLPTPYATPPNLSGNIPYVAVPVPTLSPATAYTVNFAYQDWANNPPSCKTTVTQQLGTFTTQ